MAKSCGKCGQPIPSSAWIDGRKKINLQNRRYCLNCSPFGSKNTRQLEKLHPPATPTCQECGGPFGIKQRKGRVCWKCVFASRSLRQLDRVYGVVGDACWLCGYTRGPAGRRVLDFHHVDRTAKLFSLDCRHLVNLAWARVRVELQKCVLLCANCHREVETGLIGTQEIDRIFREKWSSLSNQLPPAKSTQRKKMPRLGGEGGAE